MQIGPDQFQIHADAGQPLQGEVGARVDAAWVVRGAHLAHEALQCGAGGTQPAGSPGQMTDRSHAFGGDAAEATGDSHGLGSGKCAGQGETAALGAAHTEGVPGGARHHPQLLPVGVDQRDLGVGGVGRGAHGDQEAVGVVAAGDDRCLAFEGQGFVGVTEGDWPVSRWPPLPGSVVTEAR